MTFRKVFNGSISSSVMALSRAGLMLQTETLGNGNLENKTLTLVVTP